MATTKMSGVNYAQGGKVWGPWRTGFLCSPLLLCDRVDCHSTVWGAKPTWLGQDEETKGADMPRALSGAHFGNLTEATSHEGLTGPHTLLGVDQAFSTWG